MPIYFAEHLAQLAASDASLEGAIQSAIAAQRTSNDPAFDDIIHLGDNARRAVANHAALLEAGERLLNMEDEIDPGVFWARLAAFKEEVEASGAAMVRAGAELGLLQVSIGFTPAERGALTLDSTRSAPP